jgi:hypothetical protein
LWTTFLNRPASSALVQRLLGSDTKSCERDGMISSPPWSEAKDHNKCQQRLCLA